MVTIAITSMGVITALTLCLLFFMGRRPDIATSKVAYLMTAIALIFVIVLGGLLKVFICG